MDAALARRCWEPVTAAMTLLIFGILLFARLGHYPLWDDEALTALEAQAVWNTGDTSAIHGQNIIAFRKGVLLENLKDRAQPPLQFYLLAPITPLAGQSNFVLRLPFAIVGLGCVALVLYWLHRDRASLVFYLLVCIGMVANVSLILHCRQCRYYSLIIFLSLIIAYIYMHWRGTWGNVAWVVLFSLALFLTNYLSWALLYLVFGVDFVFFSRRRVRLSVWQWVALFVPQAVVVAYIALTRHEAVARCSELFGAHGVSRLTHVWYMLRDVNTNEFCTWPAVVFAGIVAYVRRDQLTLRGILALVIYICAAAAVYSTTAPVGEIRYVTPIIPLVLAIEAGGFAWLINRYLVLGIAATVIIFGTNVLNLIPPASDWTMPIPVRCTIADYVRELINPPDNPYTPALAWIRENIRPGQSLGVLPEHMIYPLMFYDPEIIYAWQLDWPPARQFAGLPRINFADQEKPDYFLAFGYYRQQLEEHLARRRELKGYRLVAVLPHFGIDHYRPELFWRVFSTLPVTNPQTSAIYIYRRTPSDGISTSDK